MQNSVELEEDTSIGGRADANREQFLASRIQQLQEQKRAQLIQLAEQMGNDDLDGESVNTSQISKQENYQNLRQFSKESEYEEEYRGTYDSNQSNFDGKHLSRIERFQKEYEHKLNGSLVQQNQTKFKQLCALENGYIQEQKQSSYLQEQENFSTFNHNNNKQMEEPINMNYNNNYDPSYLKNTFNPQARMMIDQGQQLNFDQQYLSNSQDNNTLTRISFPNNPAASYQIISDSSNNKNYTSSKFDLLEPTQNTINYHQHYQIDQPSYENTSNIRKSELDLKNNKGNNSHNNIKPSNSSQFLNQNLQQNQDNPYQPTKFTQYFFAQPNSQAASTNNILIKKQEQSLPTQYDLQNSFRAHINTAGRKEDQFRGCVANPMKLQETGERDKSGFSVQQRNNMNDTLVKYNLTESEKSDQEREDTLLLDSGSYVLSENNSRIGERIGSESYRFEGLQNYIRHINEVDKDKKLPMYFNINVKDLKEQSSIQSGNNSEICKKPSAFEKATELIQSHQMKKKLKTKEDRGQQGQEIIRYQAICEREVLSEKSINQNKSVGKIPKQQQQQQQQQEELEKINRMSSMSVYERNQQFLREREITRQTLLKEKQLSQESQHPFTPKIHPQSQNMVRNIEDLSNWKEILNMKNAQMRQKMVEEEIEEFDKLNKEKLICKGSQKILMNSSRSMNKQKIEDKLITSGLKYHARRKELDKVYNSNPNKNTPLINKNSFKIIQQNKNTQKGQQQQQYQDNIQNYVDWNADKENQRCQQQTHQGQSFFASCSPQNSSYNNINTSFNKSPNSCNYINFENAKYKEDHNQSILEAKNLKSIDISRNSSKEKQQLTKQECFFNNNRAPNDRILKTISTEATQFASPKTQERQRLLTETNATSSTSNNNNNNNGGIKNNSYFQSLQNHFQMCSSANSRNSSNTSNFINNASLPNNNSKNQLQLMLKKQLGSVEGINRCTRATSTNGSSKNVSQLSMKERNQYYQESKIQKYNQIVEQLKTEEAQKCPFKPRLNSSSRPSSNSSRKLSSNKSQESKAKQQQFSYAANFLNKRERIM